MENLERELLRGLEGIDLDTLKFFFVVCLGVAGVVLAARFVFEYSATQAAIREGQNALVLAQQEHLKAHADLRKNLIAIARQQSNGAIDLLRQLEASEPKAHGAA